LIFLIPFLNPNIKNMGQEFYDKWAWSHFAGGFIYRLIIFPGNSLVSFMLSVFIHLLGELIEQYKHPITGSIENGKNHWGDMTFFIAGWIVGCFFNPYLSSYKKPYIKNARFWLLIIAAILTMKEFLREIIMTDNKVVSGILY